MKPRWWWPYAIAGLAVTLSTWSLWHSYHTAQAAAVVHRLAAAEPASPSWYANERAAKRFWVGDPICAGGAVCDGSHDDTAAINSCVSQAQTVNGSIFSPHGTCKVTSEIPIHWPAHWHGDTSTPVGTILRAGGPMRSVLELRTIQTASQIDYGSSIALLENITVDGNLQATQPILMNDAENSRLVNVRAINGKFACIRDANRILPVTVSAVTAAVTGGSPTTGMSVAQADPNFYYNPSFDPIGLIDHLIIKVQTPGSLGTATYVLSEDNGTTYSTFAPNIAPRFNLVNSDGSGFVQSFTGLTATFPVGTYHTGDTYSFSVTSSNGDPFGAYAANDFVLYDKVQMGICGQVYSTSDLQSHFNPFTQTNMTGTIGTVAGNQILPGSSTSWMSMFGVGFSRGAVQVANGGTVYPYVAVVDDTHIAVVNGTQPTATVSGQSWAMTTGGGYIEDGTIEGSEVHWVSPSVGGASTCFQFANGIGSFGTHGNMNSCALAGAMLGGGSVDEAAGTTLEFWRASSGSAAYGSIPFLISPYSSGTIIEPEGDVIIGGNPSGHWVMNYHGNQTTLQRFGSASWLPISNLTLNQSPQTITSAGQTITVPDGQLFAAPGSPTTGATTFIGLTATGDYVLSAAPVIAPVAQPGMVIVLQNVGFHYFQFEDDSITSSGLKLQGAHVGMQYGDTLAIISNGVSPYHQYYRELFYSGNVYGTVNGGGNTGNNGDSTCRIQTTSSTALTPLCCFPVKNVGVAPGTMLDYSISAQSQGGANVAGWLNYQVGWDVTGHRFGYVAGTAFGSNAGSPPLGWNQAPDNNTNASQCLNVQGDSSANTVTWTARVHHRDPGQ